MDIIGEELKASREEKGLSIEEVAADLKVKVEILDLVEKGRSSEFKDIYILKDLIYDYAKYLGLDVDRLMDDFNEFMFQTTSKIPSDVIERISKQKNDEEKKKDALSPYTEDLGKYKGDKNNTIYIIAGIAVIVITIIAIIILK